MSRIVLPFFGRVDDDGNIHLPKNMRSDIVAAFKGKRIKITAQAAYKEASNEQRRYYFGVLIPWVLRLFIDAGNELQEDNRDHVKMVEEMMRRKFGVWESIATPDGEEEKILVPLSKYSTVQQEELHASIRNWVLEFFGVQIPLPNEQLKVF